MKSAYIHIPFCKQKCYYCGFCSFVNIKKIPQYLITLKNEIINSYFEDNKLETLYFGGGTPSLLNPKEIKELINLFQFQNSPEITLEINPETVNYDYLSELYDTGVNRLSIGIQSFDDYILKLIGRKHNAECSIKTIDFAKKAGFKNISIDLIYGLPEQTFDIFKNTLMTAISLGIQHISSYGLKIEENTVFDKKTPNNLPDEDLQADMYEFMTAFLDKNGYKQYEISNFAKNDFYSRHNLAYWNCEQYYGFGCGASGFQNGIRYTNISNLNEYLNDNSKKIEQIKLTTENKLEERIFLGLRKNIGINIDDINKEFNIDFFKKYNINKYKNYFNYDEKTHFLSLNKNGFLISNVILADFID